MFSDADQRLGEWAAVRDGIFDLAAARRAGLSQDQIEHRVAHLWTVMHHGVFRIPGAPLTPQSSLRAACLAGAPHAAVSHRSAAAYYDVPGRRRDLLELTCPRWLRTAQPELIVHECTRLEPHDVLLIDELPVVRPELVALQLAGAYRSVDFAESVLQAMRRKRLITYESTMQMFGRHSGRGVRGSSVLRAALERWDPTHRATESEMETLLLQVLRANALPEAVPQYEIYDRAGVFVARVDAAVVPWRAAVDYDSKQEHSDEFQLARDNSRRNRIRAAGWHPVTARHKDLLAGGTELAAAIRACARESA
jgi:hypothetical protein